MNEGRKNDFLPRDQTISRASASVVACLFVAGPAPVTLSSKV
jgi:hypothetical protein